MAKKPTKKPAINCLNLKQQIADANLCDKRRDLQTKIYNKLTNNISSPKTLPSPTPPVCIEPEPDIIRHDEKCETAKPSNKSLETDPINVDDTYVLV